MRLKNTTDAKLYTLAEYLQSKHKIIDMRIEVSSQIIQESISLSNEKKNKV